MAKKNTISIRSDRSLKEIIDKVKGKKMMQGKIVNTSRITLAMSRQYKKYPNLMKELEDADLR